MNTKWCCVLSSHFGLFGSVSNFIDTVDRLDKEDNDRAGHVPISQNRTFQRKTCKMKNPMYGWVGPLQQREKPFCFGFVTIIPNSRLSPESTAGRIVCRNKNVINQISLP